MTYTKYKIVTGEIISVYDMPEHMVLNQLSEGESYIEGSFHPSTYYIDNDLPLEIPSKPSNHHVWVAKAWTLSSEGIENLKTELKNTVSEYMLNLSTQPILYDSKPVDADSKAISNINGKLRELEAKIALGLTIDTGLLFWKDADNVIHTWDTVVDYINWLHGLVIAIAERTTMLYSVSWAKKLEIDSITDTNVLLSYDITTGWAI